MRVSCAVDAGLASMRSKSLCSGAYSQLLYIGNIHLGIRKDRPFLVRCSTESFPHLLFAKFSAQFSCDRVSKRRSRGPLMMAKKGDTEKAKEGGQYKHTVDLPQTNFSLRANSVVRETEIQKLWEQNKVLEKVLERNDGTPFVLHDGPPYANGDLHIGHALKKILEDFINRFQLLQGRKVVFLPGWDCHGLPIELKVLQSMDPEARKGSTSMKLWKKASQFALKTVEQQCKSFKEDNTFTRCYKSLGDVDNDEKRLNAEEDFISSNELRTEKVSVLQDTKQNESKLVISAGMASAAALALALAGSISCSQAWAAPDIASVQDTISWLGDLDDIKSGFLSAFLLIFFSEIGDKTFFIAAILASRKSNAAVFTGTFSALVAMTFISVFLGRTFHYIDGILPFSLGENELPLDDVAAVILLVYFGIATLLEAASMEGSKAEEEQQEAELAIAGLGANGEGSAIANTALATFGLVFVAEWGDKSFFSTVALSAASSPIGVVSGAIAGHGVATLLAVLGGSFLSNYISERVTAYIGGSLFLIFAAFTLYEIVS